LVRRWTRRQRSSAGWIAEVRALATSNLERKLTVNARDLPEFEQLLQLEMAYVDAQLLGDACPEQRLTGSAWVPREEFLNPHSDR
jgi:hypothetical protein